MKTFAYAVLTVVLLTSGTRAVAARPEKAAMEDALGLTDEQSVKLKDAMKAHRRTLKPLRRQSEDAMAKLQELLESKAGDADIQAGLDQLKSSHKAMIDEMDKFDSSLASFLTPTQQAKKAIDKKRQMRGGWGGRKPGGEGPPRERPDRGGDEHQDGGPLEKELGD